MKRPLLTAVILIFAVIFPLGALELGVSFDMGNISFPDAPLTSSDFPSAYPWGASVDLRQIISEGMEVQLNYRNDRVVNHLVSSTFLYSGEFFSIGAGPAFGVFNSSQVALQPGMATEFKVSWPGKFFLSFDMLSSIGFRLSNTGDYSQGVTNLSMGFYVPNAICTLGMDQKVYTEVVATHGEATDKQTDFSFKADIFQKNVPYRILIGLIYRQHSKQYIRTVITGTDFPELAIATQGIKENLNSILLQSKVTLTLNPALTFVLDAHTNLFSFGKIVNDADDTSELLSLPSTAPGSFLFEASLGFVLNLDALQN